MGSSVKNKMAANSTFNKLSIEKILRIIKRKWTYKVKTATQSLIETKRVISVNVVTKATE